MYRFHISDELISYIWIVRINFSRHLFHIYSVDKRPQDFYLLGRQHIFRMLQYGIYLQRNRTWVKVQNEEVNLKLVVFSNAGHEEKFIAKLIDVVV